MITVLHYYSLPVPIVMLSIPVTPPLIIKEFDSTLAMQVYSPDWFLPNDLTTAVLVYVVAFSITELVTGMIATPAGPDTRAVTVTGTSTSGLKSTVQVRVTADPTGRMGLTGVLLLDLALEENDINP